MSAANCNTYGGGHTTCTTPPQTVVTVPSTTKPASPSGLPFTGGDVVGLSLIGVGAIVVGSFMARTKRRVSA